MIRATSRCRVDLAGGTLDIWPIGLLHAGSATVNVAVDLAVRVTLEGSENGFRVRQGQSVSSAATAGELVRHRECALVGWVARHLELPPVDVEISSDSPRGAGLGASSALAVSLLAAGELLLHGRLLDSEQRRSATARDLEAQMMGLPTGIQDHLPAQLGGALAIEHRPGGELVRRLAVDLDELARVWIVAYTGQSHFSAGNNWKVLRRRFEADPEIVARLDRIRDVSAELPERLQSGDWAEVGRLVAQEWDARRGLAPEVSNATIETLLDAAKVAGAWGGKACGAGGGGCVVALAPAGRRAAIEQAWRALGAELLPAWPTALGLETESSA